MGRKKSNDNRLCADHHAFDSKKEEKEGGEDQEGKEESQHNQ